MAKPIPIKKVAVESFKVPTDFPESDGTIEWKETPVHLVFVTAGGKTGMGYGYTGEPAAKLIEGKLAQVVKGRDALDVPATWLEMVRQVRNTGRPGIASEAISAVDVALWDLKAKLLDLPLCRLLGSERASVPVYGSGGFTSYSVEQLRDQLGGWAAQGIRMVKMKIGREPEHDFERVRAAREAIGPRVELFVDANGAYTRKQALRFADAFAELDVRWFEEPVSSDDLEGLRLIRDRAPARMDIAAGEYGYDHWYFRAMLEAQAVDVLQADITRCLGVTGFLRAAALCDAFQLPLSAHTAPAAHLHACLAAPRIVHLEYFHDHVRIEHAIFDGAPSAKGGELRPDLARPGIGLELRRADVKRLAA